MLKRTSIDQVSPRAIRLAIELVGIVRKRRVRDPQLTWFDVLEAQTVVRRELSYEFGSNERRRRRVILALVVAAAIGMLAVMLATSSS